MTKLGLFLYMITVINIVKVDCDSNVIRNLFEKYVFDNGHDDICDQFPNMYKYIGTLNSKMCLEDNNKKKRLSLEELDLFLEKYKNKPKEVFEVYKGHEEGSDVCYRNMHEYV